MVEGSVRQTLGRTDAEGKAPCVSAKMTSQAVFRPKLSQTRLQRPGHCSEDPIVVYWAMEACTVSYKHLSKCHLLSEAVRHCSAAAKMSTPGALTAQHI